MSNPEIVSVRPATAGQTGIESLRVLDEKSAAALLGVSHVTLERMRRAGRAPRHVQLSARRLGYRISDLTAWLDARAGA